jgi:SAM-dependent methyltransferase
VVVPTVQRLLEGSDTSVVLDIGSGTGDFTIRLAQSAQFVVAVEPSGANMALARTTCASASNIRFVEASLESSVQVIGDVPPTAAVAVMTLMTVPDLPGFTAALGAVLRKGSRFIAIFTHPCFWPRYWGYQNEPWFQYESEIFIEAPFAISKHRSEFRTTHIHRPLETYINTFAEQGFRLDRLVEPMPEAAVQAMYPKEWDFPRFIGLRWEKT